MKGVIFIGPQASGKSSFHLENFSREGKERIPEIGIRTTFNKIEPPDYSEGFDKLYRVSIAGDKFHVEEWQ